MSVDAGLTDQTRKRYDRMAPIYDGSEAVMERFLYAPWRRLLWSGVKGPDVLEVDLSQIDVQALAFSSDNVDTMVASFVPCSVPDPRSGLRIGRMQEPSIQSNFAFIVARPPQTQSTVSQRAAWKQDP